MSEANPNNEFQIERNWAVDEIKVGIRHRKDLGDIPALADSIAKSGMHCMITITPDGFLVCGARRLAAAKLLGFKYLRVHVRSDLSDNAAALVAQLDDDRLTKPLDPVEQAALSEELCKVVAANAARRQQAAQFLPGELNVRAQNPRSDGGSKLEPPSHQAKENRKTRLQVAEMIGGLGATTLDKVNSIRQIAADDKYDAAVREKAANALDSIAGGKAIDPAFKEVKALAALDTLASAACDESRCEAGRASAAKSLNKIATIHAESPLSAEGLARMVEGAMNRVNNYEKSNKLDAADIATSAKPEQCAQPKPVQDFVHVWTTLASWPSWYDPAQIAIEVPDDKWTAFVETTHEAIEFINAVNAHRAALETTK